MKISIFEKLKNSNSVEYIELTDALDYIKNGRSGWTCEQIRIYDADYKNEIDDNKRKEIELKKRELKEKLPCIVFQGEFNKRAKDGLINHSGIACLDFDHVKDAVRTRNYYFNNYSYVVSAFISPSGDGVKLLIKIPVCKNDEEYKEYYSALLYYFENAADKQTSDISRICFESYDKDILIRDYDLATIFTKKIAEIRQIEEINKSFNTPINSNKILNIAARMINEAADGEKHYTLLKASRLMGGYIAGNIVDEQLAIDTLETCIQGRNISSFKDAQKTIRNSIEYGKKTPIYSFIPMRNTNLGNISIPQKVSEIQHTTDFEITKPKFPIEVFPEPIQNYFLMLNEALNFSIDFMSVAFIFSIATLNGNAVKLKVKTGWTAPTIFWFAVVGEPGTMKSHPVSEIIKPLKQIDKASKNAFDNELEFWEAQETKITKRPVYRQLLVSDYTLESLHDVHSYNKKGLGLYKDELVAFINDMNKYRSGSDEQFWLESFNNSSYIINRVTKDPKVIDNISVNLIGTIQPAVLSKVASSNNGNGLIDRFLFTSAETEIYPMTDRMIEQIVIDGYVSDMIKFEQKECYYDGSESKIMKMENEAFDLFLKYDLELVTMQKSDTETNDIKTYLSKMKTYIPRFALVIRLIENYFGVEYSEKVNAEDLKKSWLLAKYFINSAKKVFYDSDKKEEVNKVSQPVKFKTKPEQVIHLHKSGYSNKDIAIQLKMAASNVSKYIGDWKKNQK